MTLPIITSAAPVVITFDEPVISNENVATRLEYQYVNKGITFNTPKVIDYSRLVNPERFQGFLHSGTKAIEQCYGMEFCVTPIQMNFAAPQKRVKVWVGYSSLGNHDNKIIVIMRAFNQNGAQIKEMTRVFQSGTGPIPIKTDMEIESDSANIYSVKLNLASDTSNPTSTNHLAIDDVEFDTVASAPPCYTTENPVVTISQPTSGQILRSNVFNLKGTISTTQPLYNAKLITTGSDGTSRLLLDLLDSNYNLNNGGFFSDNGISDGLFLGSNTVTVKAQNCRGSSESSIKLTYQPCDSTLEPVVTIIEPISSDIVISNPPRLKGNINPPDNIKKVTVIVSAGLPINTGFNYFEIQPNDQGAFDYQFKWGDLFSGCENIIEVIAQSGNGCSGQADTKIVFIKNDALKSIKGRILYEDATSDGITFTGFKPARYCKFNLILNYEAGGLDVPCLTDKDGNFNYVAQTITGNGLLNSAEINLGTNFDEYHVNRAVRISRDLELCNEYVWWKSDTKRAWIGKDLDFGDLRIGKDHDLEFKGYWQEHEHSWGACGGPIHSLPGGSAYFNIADVILYAREYADAQREEARKGHYDQGADDNIGEVAAVWPVSTNKPLYDAIWNEICINDDFGFNDGAIVHEYAHYLTEAISTLSSGGPDNHLPCTQTDRIPAWIEGFAEYYGTIVPYRYTLSNPNINYGTIEDMSCSGTLSESYEGAVDAVLWDVVDEPGIFPNSKTEAFDTLSGNEAIVFSIFDNELAGPVLYADLCNFINNGWLNKRLPLSQQDRDAIKPICQHYNIGCVPP